MTIRAKQPQITLVSRPILEPARPSVLPVFRPNLFGWVNVVNIQYTVIIVSARYTLAAKLLNKPNLSFPIPRSFVRFVAVFIPIITIAARRAKTVITFLAALFAFPLFAPSGREVAGLLAILSCSICDAIGMSFKRLRAMAANNFNLRVLSHGESSIKVFAHYTPKYFDIACERITNAYRQERLFE